MNLLSRRMMKKLSCLTVVLFFLSIFSLNAQTPEVYIPASNAGQNIDISVLGNAFPQLNSLQANLRTSQNTLTSLERVATPIYNKVTPTNMETMSVIERVKAILKNSKGLLSSTVNGASKMATEKVDAGIPMQQLPLDEQLAYSVHELGVQAGKLSTGKNTSGMIAKLKSVLSVVKDRLQIIINAIRAKIFAVGQKVGLISKDKRFDGGKVKENRGVIKPDANMQYADTFSGKLAKGVAEGTKNAKNSLKNSFSFSNLAITTGVAVGTNLAIDMIHGKKPSFKQAVKQVATLEFAGNVAGAALGAAGGQFAGTLVKTFMPGPIGALVGSVIPVMFASGAGQMGSNLVSGLKHGNFSVARAWKSIDKVDLVGSSIGSTIGMALGAPIPVIGPIIGGIVGGVIGSKVAKWISGFTKGKKFRLFSRKGSDVRTGVGGTSSRSEGITLGHVAGGVNTNQNGGAVTYNSGSVEKIRGSNVSASELKEVEMKYYDTYLRYNRMVESGDSDGAKKVFEQLKTYSDQYSQMKKQIQK